MGASGFRAERGRGVFTTTRWSLVVAAGDESAPQAEEAIAALCASYWTPIYAYVRRHGGDADQARDLTQGFFATLLEKNYVGDARRERGRFRTFLLAALKHYLANEADREGALKRGGGRAFVSLDALQEEEGFVPPAHEETPERIFDRRWARALLDASFARLKEEMAHSAGLRRFERLFPYLTGDDDTAYRDAAADLGISEQAVKIAVHRLRGRFRAILRDEVAQTVGDPAEVDAELSHLLSILAA